MMNVNSKNIFARLSATTYVAAGIFCFTLLVFAFSQVRQITDSNYSMLLSQSLVEHGTFKLDNYNIPRLEPFNRGYFTSNGAIYQLELANNHIYYHLPPGSSVLSAPYVALTRLFGLKATNPDGTYNREGETKIEASLAALLMATLAVIFFYTARLLLPIAWSACLAIGATLGTQIWSTASRAMWTDTWGILLLGIVILMLVAHETRRRTLNPIWLATLLSWTYFVRPTNAIHILAITAYLLIYHRRLFIPYALTGALWFAGFVFYSWHNFRQLLPSYYQSSRLNFSVFWTALAGNLISPARGLLVYVPVLLFVAYLLVRYWRYVKFQRLVILSLAIICGHLVAVSGFPHWWGGHSYGPRFTTGLVPWLVLPAILGVEALLAWRREHQASVRQSAGWRAQLITGALLLFVSMFIHARGAMSHETWLWNTRPIGVDEHPERLWDWREPQFLAGWVASPLPQSYPLVAGYIDFSTGDADKYLWYGWADREERFRWTDGKEATVVFGLNPVTDIRLAMKLGPFLSKPEMSEQRVHLILNGRQIETLVLNEEKANEYRLLLPKNLLREKNLLTFRLPDANSPRAFGKGEDPRQLGIAMYWMQLQPHASATQSDAGQ
ncbi:MAG: hypothetical protein ICV68_01570 [Pyrinomonadaceae bacterium]|nr:hypothetical protein [Pyrinomonadaceae bacterium]